MINLACVVTTWCDHRFQALAPQFLGELVQPTLTFLSLSLPYKHHGGSILLVSFIRLFGYHRIVMWFSDWLLGSCPAQGSSGTLAYASACQRDQFDRPILGGINFCPYSVPTSTASDSTFNMMLFTTMHELTHALGMTMSAIIVALLCC